MTKIVPMYLNPKILLCGDTGLTVEFGDTIDPEINARVRYLCTSLKTLHPAGILDLNPTYRSLFIQYDPWVCSFEHLLQIIEDCLESATTSEAETAQVKEVPVCYGGEFGPDLEEVASFHTISADEVIRLHCAPLYQVYMIGFTPGFAYLGGLDEKLHTPRKKDPRKKVAAGLSRNRRPTNRHLSDRKPWRLATHRQDTASALRSCARSSLSSAGRRFCQV